MGGRCDAERLAVCRKVRQAFRRNTEQSDVLLSAIARDTVANLLWRWSGHPDTGFVADHCGQRPSRELPLPCKSPELAVVHAGDADIDQGAHTTRSGWLDELMGVSDKLG